LWNLTPTLVKSTGEKTIIAKDIGRLVWLSLLALLAARWPSQKELKQAALSRAHNPKMLAEALEAR